MSNFNLTKMAVNMFCPGNVVQLDDAGLPSVLVYIPAFKNSDVLTGGDDSIHPAFIVNGVQIPGFYYSKYENVVHNGKAYSLPAETPAFGVTFKEAYEYCNNKGYGWHLSTAAEWAAIALWCKKNGFIPNGNNNYGKDAKESEYKAIPATYSADGKIDMVATGTGPITWSHDNTKSGIWDLNGNVVEWQGGLRLVWGELQILANNDAADPDNPQNQTSTCWKAINAANGSLVEPESKTTDTAAKTSGSTVKLDYLDGIWTFSTGVSNAVGTNNHSFASLKCTETISDAAKMLLRSLALLPEDGVSYDGDYIHFNNNMKECCVLRGGVWSHHASAGLFSLLGYYGSENTTGTFGFRAAYIPNI